MNHNDNENENILPARFAFSCLERVSFFEVVLMILKIYNVSKMVCTRTLRSTLRSTVYTVERRKM